MSLYNTNSAFCQVFIRLVAGSGANTACTFIFRPVWVNGDDLSASTDDAHKISIAITTTGATPITSTTLIPAYQIYGARKLRLQSITHPDEDPSSRVDILQCRLVGVKGP